MVLTNEALFYINAMSNVAITNKSTNKDIKE